MMGVFGNYCVGWVPGHKNGCGCEGKDGVASANKHWGGGRQMTTVTVDEACVCVVRTNTIMVQSNTGVVATISL